VHKGKAGLVAWPILAGGAWLKQRRAAELSGGGTEQRRKEEDDSGSG